MNTDLRKAVKNDFERKKRYFQANEQIVLVKIKKQKAPKCEIEKLKFEDYKICLEASF